MDLQKVIKQVLELLNNNESLVKEFLADPAKVLESKLGIDLPNEQVNAVVEGVKTKLKLDDAASVLSAVQGLFGKK